MGDVAEAGAWGTAVGRPPGVVGAPGACGVAGAAAAVVCGAPGVWGAVARWTGACSGAAFGTAAAGCGADATEALAGGTDVAGVEAPGGVASRGSGAPIGDRRGAGFARGEGASVAERCTGAPSPGRTGEVGVPAGPGRVAGFTRGASATGGTGESAGAGLTWGAGGGVDAVALQSAPGARRERRTGARRCTGVPGALSAGVGIPGPVGETGPGTFGDRPGVEAPGAVVGAAPVVEVAASLPGVRGGAAARWTFALPDVTVSPGRSVPAGARRRGGCTGRAETRGVRRTGASRTGARRAAPAVGASAGVRALLPNASEAVDGALAGAAAR
ncbi:hypothetical protein ABZY68_08540 [Streptomyces sp. NPDC006482]|uniref:hypothetical protein n=1 Tax=Streptomyces sp. NPDC006482 TaxID=3154306 RepID=UPI0033A586A7